jgi:hypothetical protein
LVEEGAIRNIPLIDEYDGPGKCIVTGEAVDRRAVIAKDSSGIRRKRGGRSFRWNEMERRPATPPHGLEQL